MSRRFGRNQRRRAREALAVEVQRTEQTAKLAEQRLQMYRHSQDELGDFRDFFMEVARRVGRESILVPGGEGEAELDSPLVRQFMAIPRMDALYTPVSWSEPAVSAIKAEIMNRLEVQAVREAFSNQIVVRCYLNGHEAGIALSHSFLRKSTEDEIARRVSQDLARNISRAIKAAQ